MLIVVFWTGWGLGHQHPLPPGPFPEGWTIYALLSPYTILGTGLVAGIARVPRNPTAAEPTLAADGPVRYR